MIQFGIYYSISEDCDEGYIIEDDNFQMTRHIYCGECMRLHEFVLEEHFYKLEDLWSFLAENESFQ